MADKELAALTAAGALDGSELVHVVQSGNSRKATAQDFADLGGSALTPPTSSALSTVVNPTAGSAPTVTDGTNNMTMVASAHAGVHARLQSLPGGDFSVRCKVSAGYSQSQYCTMGLIFRDNAGTPKFTGFGIHKPFNSFFSLLRSENWSSKDAFSGDSFHGAAVSQNAFLHDIFLRCDFVESTNDFTFWFGPDGVDWLQLVGTNSYLGTCDAVGVGILNGGTADISSGFFSHFEIV